MASALTRAETEDFAAARAPPQAPQVLDDTATAASSTDSIKRRFTFKRLSHKRDAIVETALEDAGSPSSTPAGSCLYPSSTMNGRVDVKPAVGPMDFDLLCVIGQGAFGKVIQVRHVPTDEAERDIMIKINHPFLISLRYAFQTKSNVYLVMPFVAGGELFHHLHKQGLLLESSAKFYAAEMVLALEHLHVKEYMPPEMIRRKAYNQAVDWWALGALIYEMVTGYPPFRHKNRKKLHQKILNEKLSLPKWLGSETHSILKQLLERNVDKRLGSGKSTMFQVKGVQAIKKHAFFRDIDWGLLEQKKVQPPILPNVVNSTDTTYFSEEFTTQDVGRRSRVGSSSGDGDTKKLFARFSWVADDAPSFADIIRAGTVETDTITAAQDGVEKLTLADETT
uniref:Protein kinase domain-containing protein n=1 Tax=Hyaloperonospora arabidopsidis (strain Emoy2) TaxID=559515 RepID=M4C5S0_HYAAE